MTHKRRRRGFKLIEALFVVAVLIMLIGLLIPAVQKVRVNDNGRTCLNNLKQLGFAAHSYHSAREKFPPGFDDRDLSCLFNLLPYLEQNLVCTQIISELELVPQTVWSAGSAKMLELAAVQIPTFLCPSDPVPPGAMLGTGSVLFANSSNVGPTLVTTGPAGKTSIYGRANYTGVAGVAGSGHLPGVNATAGIDLHQFEGIFTKQSATALADVKDGTSNTLLFGEGLGGTLNPRDTQWTWMGVGSLSTWAGLPDGVKMASSASEFSSAHAGVVNFCLADGSVKSLRIGKTATAPFGTVGDWYILQQLAGMRDGSRIEDAATLIVN